MLGFASFYQKFFSILIFSILPFSSSETAFRAPRPTNPQPTAYSSLIYPAPSIPQSSEDRPNPKIPSPRALIKTQSSASKSIKTAKSKAKTAKPTKPHQAPISKSPLTSSPNHSSRPITNTITINGRTLPIFSTNSTMTDSQNSVAKFGQKFLYGHNSPEVFKSLPNLPIGSNFAVKINNQTTRYVIKKTITLTKADTKRFMFAIANGRYLGQTYSLSLMTCAGSPRPNRDATHRYIVFADRV